MGWANSPDLSRVTSETVTDVANVAFRSDLQTQLPYPPTAGFYQPFPSPSAGPNRVQYANVYMNDINCLTQGDEQQQRRLIEIVMRTLKSVYPRWMGNSKTPSVLRKLRQETEIGASLKKYWDG